MDYSQSYQNKSIFAWVFLISLFLGSLAGLYSVFMKPRPASNNSTTSEPTVSHSTTAEPSEKTTTSTKTELAKEESSEPTTELYAVLSVTDGDTIRIDYHGENTPLRLIGIDTPETVDERTIVQCFGQEASDYLKAKLTGKKVSIEADPTQSDRDKYDRLLRYIYLDGEDVGLDIIANGYGHEYTYDIPYQKQAEYKSAEKDAEQHNLGLWAPTACSGANSTNSSPSDSSTPVVPQQTTECNIKGNISNKGEKIYHVPGQRYYDATIITPSKGERMFCTEQEAIDAGWRKSKV